MNAKEPFLFLRVTVAAARDRYDVLNLQGSANEQESQLHYVEVGTWSTGKLTLNTSAIRFFSEQRTLEEINVRRFCSEACPTGQIKVRLSMRYLVLNVSLRNTRTRNAAAGNAIPAATLSFSTK